MATMTASATITTRAERIEKVFQGLTENGLDFLERAANDLEGDPKLSSVHFAIGLELLLKARLFKEHWALVFDPPLGKQTTLQNLIEGSFKSVQASDLAPALGRIVGNVGTPECTAFKYVFDRRNKSVHFKPDEGLAISVEQFRAWYYLHGLLTVIWNEQFCDFYKRIEDVHRALKKNESFLDVRFEKLSPQIKKAAGAGLIVACPFCGRDSAELGQVDVAVTTLHCWVCQNHSHSARLRCECRYNWAAKSELCPKTGSPHDLDDVMRDLLGGIRDPIYCGHCENPAVMTTQMTPSLFCLACQYEHHDQAECCEQCDTLWVGSDMAESGLYGCPLVCSDDLEFDE